MNTKPRLNYHMAWQVCGNCTLDYWGTAGSPCPNCLDTVRQPSATLCWSIIALWVTVCALAVTGVWALVMR